MNEQIAHYHRAGLPARPLSGLGDSLSLGTVVTVVASFAAGWWVAKMIFKHAK